MKNVFDITPQQVQSQKKKRVAAYARVSSGKDAMLHSLKAQIDYYHDYINRNPEWALVRLTLHHTTNCGRRYVYCRKKWKTGQ